MKRFSIAYWASLLLALPLWFACQSTTLEEKTTTTVVEIPVAAKALTITQSETLAQHFGPIIRGAWVNANYLAVVTKTKSPIVAFDSSGYVSEILINPAIKSGDSLLSGVGYGNHEGGDITIYFRAGEKPNALPTNQRDYESPGSFTELSYQLSSQDTTLLLTTYNKSRKVVRQAKYQRIPGAGLSQLEVLNYAVNKLLFVGNYTGVDSIGRPVRIQFTANGRINGLKGAKKYNINTDFGAGPGNDIDHLTLDINSKQSRLLSYSHNADTLRLYSASVIETKLKPGTDDELIDEKMTKGRLLFTLIRQ